MVLRKSCGQSEYNELWRYYYDFSSAIIINSSVVCISPRQAARIYDCCTISKRIIDMTGGVLEEEKRMLSKADRGNQLRFTTFWVFCSAHVNRLMAIVQFILVSILLCHWFWLLNACSFSGTVRTCPRFSGQTRDSDYPFILLYGKYAARRG